MNMTTVPSNQLKAMQHEIADLKEQVAQLEHDFNLLKPCNQCDVGCMLSCSMEANGMKETIAQQAEAIRVKDAALDWCIGEFNLRLYDIDLSQETIRVRSARHIQPSPEILQARDEQVAAACANLVNRFISGDGILNDTWVHEIEDAICSGEWRKYL